MKGQQAPTASAGFLGRQAVRSAPVQTASINRNRIAGTIRNHSSSALAMVIRMLVGELNRRVQEPDEACGLHRGRPLGHQILADEIG